MRRRYFIISFLLLLSLLLYLSCERSERKRPRLLFEQKWKVASTDGGGADIQLLNSIQNSLIQVADKVLPSVVNISTLSQPGARGPRPFPFFGERRRRAPTSLGSGIIIDDRGHIITNYHVIRDSKEIVVGLYDGKEFPAQVIGGDPDSDLAVLRIEAKGPLPPAPLGDSDGVKVGQWAIAIGNPFGLDRTVTFGVVSAIDRPRLGLSYQNFIQTDASINPGNSGGPLLNIQGEVIGINTAMMAWGQGIGFAIPINSAKSVVAELMEKGKVVRPWLGVGIEPLTPELASALGIRTEAGVLINRVFNGSPAQGAGLKAGDVIVRFQGKEINGARGLQKMVAGSKIGQEVVIGLIREGRKIELTARLGEMPKDPAILAEREVPADWLGIRVQELSPSQAQRLRVGSGVMVMDLIPGSIADRAGVLHGDVIFSVNQRRIKGASEYHRQISSLRPGSNITFQISRRDTQVQLSFKAEK